MHAEIHVLESPISGQKSCPYRVQRSSPGRQSSPHGNWPRQCRFGSLDGTLSIAILQPGPTVTSDDPERLLWMAPALQTLIDVLAFGRVQASAPCHRLSFDAGSDRKALSMLVDCGHDFSRKRQMRLFLIPERVKFLDGVFCRRDDKV